MLVWFCFVGLFFRLSFVWEDCVLLVVLCSFIWEDCFFFFLTVLGIPYIFASRAIAWRILLTCFLTAVWRAWTVLFVCLFVSLFVCCPGKINKQKQQTKANGHYSLPQYWKSDVQYQTKQTNKQTNKQTHKHTINTQTTKQPPNQANKHKTHRKTTKY